MGEKERKDLLRRAKAMMKDRELTDVLSAAIEGERGKLGFLLGTLRSRPRTFNPYVLKGISVFREPVALDSRTAELVAVAAAAALRCEHCLEAHMDRAMAEGATADELMDAILISAAISESSSLSVSLRKLARTELKRKRTRVAKKGP